MAKQKQADEQPKQQRKVLVSNRHIVLEAGRTYFTGQHLVAPQEAQELVAAGASYVADEDYNSAITAQEKVEADATS